jgi:hypothetical protein
MKKNECITCNNQTCGDCSKLSVNSNRGIINPDSYASEFMLYAFHFHQEANSINEFRIQNSEFRIQNPEFRIQNSEFRIHNSTLIIQHST